MALKMRHHTFAIVQRSLGFTMIELVIVITLMSAVGVLVARLFTQPFVQYEAASRRAELASLANASVNRMQLDLQSAVPNSVRVTFDSTGHDIAVLELMLVVDGGRYRYADDSDKSETNALSPGYLDDRFHVLGGLSTLTSIPIGYRLVVNPFNASVLYAAAANIGVSPLGVITPASSFTLALTKNIVAGTSNEDRIVMSSDFRFDILGNGSPRNRFYITNTPVTYRCTESDGQLIRYTGYDVKADISTLVPTGSNLNTGLVLNNITDCEFIYSAGISQRLGTVILNLQMSQENESVSIVKQVRVYNAP